MVYQYWILSQPNKFGNYNYCNATNRLSALIARPLSSDSFASAMHFASDFSAIVRGRE